MHFDRIAIGGGFTDRVSPRAGVQVDEAKDEGIHEKCDASGGGVRRCKETGPRLAQTIVFSPKHNKNVRDVVHPGPVHVFSFFVGRGHEQ